MHTTPDVLVRRVIEEAWNRGRLEVIDDTVAPGYTRRVPGDVLRGPDAFKARIHATRLGLPDFTTRIAALVVDGDEGVVVWAASGTHHGPLFGLPPSGRRLGWSGMTRFRCEAGWLVEEWELFDRAELLAQLE
jgi:predicted ester cyclase